MEPWRRAAGVAIWRYGALNACCNCGDVEIWSSGVALQAWGRGGIDGEGRTRATRMQVCKQREVTTQLERHCRLRYICDSVLIKNGAIEFVDLPRIGR